MSNAQYWDRQAGPSAMWHIAHQKEDDKFWETGEEVVGRFYRKQIENLPHDARVLDIGCGMGRLSRAALKLRPDLQVFGIDVSPKMIKKANAARPASPQLVFLIGNGVDFSMFDQNYFDMVFSHVVFQHLPSTVFYGYCADVRRILKRNGVFAFQLQYNKELLARKHELSNDDFRTIRHYNDDEARDVLAPHFEQVRAKSPGEAEKLHNLIVIAKRPIPVSDKSKKSSDPKSASKTTTEAIG